MALLSLLRLAVCLIVCQLGFLPKPTGIFNCSAFYPSGVHPTDSQCAFWFCGVNGCDDTRGAGEARWAGLVTFCGREQHVDPVLNLFSFVVYTNYTEGTVEVYR